MLMSYFCREHDQPRPASNSGRLNRKRPSMLSEFHGSKYHTHNMREGDRDGLVYRDFSPVCMYSIWCPLIIVNTC